MMIKEDVTTSKRHYYYYYSLQYGTTDKLYQHVICEKAKMC